MNNNIEIYTLGLLTEECGEINQAVGKCLRFGKDTPKSNENPITGQDELNIECGDILAAIQYAINKGILNEEVVYKQKWKKLEKLLFNKDLAP